MMKVLLVTDVKRLGWLGDVVEVSEGYARNYLLPQGFSVLVTKVNLKAIAEEKKKRAEVRKHEGKRLEETAAAVEGAEAVLAVRANEQGVLFGSVTPSDIAGNLREQGFEVADSQVQLHEHIKQVGTSQVTLKFSEARPSEGLAEDLTATVSVVVVAQQLPPASVSVPLRLSSQDEAAGETKRGGKEDVNESVNQDK